VTRHDGRTRDRLERLSARVVRCRLCPRLRAYCTEVAREKRKAYRDWTYWGKPVPGFGDPGAVLFILGLAPAAHGGNRTGRVFTGDRSGDFLYAALYRAGFANQPRATARDDGLRLRGAYVAAAVRCAPPDNKPDPQEASNCRRYLLEELEVLPRIRAVLALGKFAHDAYVTAVRARGVEIRAASFPFRHGARHALAGPVLFDAYHPSQQNTFTGRLTPAAFDAVLAAVNRYLHRGP
jgi:uracil-DNA glycosylase family 4